MPSSAFLSECSTPQLIINPSGYHALEYANITMVHPGRSSPVAQLRAFIIDRANCAAGQFAGILDGRIEPLMTIRDQIFDIEGRLRRKFVDDVHHRGTGCWGPETNGGKLVVVMHVGVCEEQVGAQYVSIETRNHSSSQLRHGLGTAVLQALLTSRHISLEDFVVAMPAAIPDYQDDEVSTKFFHKARARAASHIYAHTAA